MVLVTGKLLSAVHAAGVPELKPVSVELVKIHACRLVHPRALVEDGVLPVVVRLVQRLFLIRMDVAAHAPVIAI